MMTNNDILLKRILDLEDKIAKSIGEKTELINQLTQLKVDAIKENQSINTQQLLKG